MRVKIVSDSLDSCIKVIGADYEHMFKAVHFTNIFPSGVS